MRFFKLALQFTFYALILALLISRSMSAVISHDENQFIAAAQLLVHQGLLPYLNFPYTHMPYGVAFYAAVLSLTSYDYLASRLLTSVVWLLCLLLITVLTRLVRGRPASLLSEPTSFLELLWEFAVALILVYHPVSTYVLVTAANHSFATFFSLLALFFFVRATRPASFSYRDPLYAGLSIALAAFSRFNYASLIVVLLVLWLLHSLLFHLSRAWKVLLRFLLGVFISAIPLLVLIALAPAHFYYANLVYIRLNTIYYEGLLYRSGMSLVPKILGFGLGVRERPIDWLLYAALLSLAGLSLVRLLRRRSLLDLGMFATAGFASALWLTAFAPTPILTQYFFAPIPFMLVLLAWVMSELQRFGMRAYLAGLVVMVAALAATVRIPNPLSELAFLDHPDSWTPIEVHDFAFSLEQYVPRGTILTLLPMVPLEAGYDVYPFTATGAFNWRTSLLLTASRRAQYGVISPVELPAVLSAAPPIAVLTGFETPNAGFGPGDQGGLETPLNDFAMQHGYERIELTPRFLAHPLTLWVRPN